MASTFELDADSDSEDVDYEPPAGDESSEEEEPPPSCKNEREYSCKKILNKQISSKSSEIKNQLEKINSLEVNALDEKRRADVIYERFLEEAASEFKDSKDESTSSRISFSGSNASSPTTLNYNNNACQPSATSTLQKYEESIQKVPSIIGNTINPSTSNSLCLFTLSKSNTVSTLQPAVKRKGLESVVGNILNKKQKSTILSQSILDWKNFKEEEGIEQDLAFYNRGKSGFLERKKFLERSDLRRFEIERDMRMTKRQIPAKKFV